MSMFESDTVESHVLSRLMIQVADRARADFAEVVSGFDLPVPVARTLLILAEPMPMREVAQQLACDPSYVTGIADQLNERGYVTRVPGRDRRITLLKLTDEGSVVRDTLAAEVRARVGFIQHLNADERVVLRSLLERILEDNEIFRFENTKAEQEKR